MQLPLHRSLIDIARHAFVACLVAAAVAGIFLVAPTEATMGHAQRILYIHVAVAWFALAAYLAMAATGLAYLATRKLACDHWSRAAAEVGWLCCTLTLITGSFWARAAWNTWWTWDPRLTTVFALWALYSAYLLIRSGLEGPQRSARLGAVVAILGALDLPLIVLATRWFRGIHPPSPQMDPTMRVVLWLSVIGFGAVFFSITAYRKTQLHLESAIAVLEQHAEGEPSWTHG